MKHTGVSEITYAARILEVEEGFSSYSEMGTFGDLENTRVSRDWMEKDASILAYDFWVSNKTGFYKELSIIRKSVCICIAYQLGFKGFLNFKNALIHLNDGNFAGAAIELMDSKWARASTFRAERYAEMIETGEIHDFYTDSWDQPSKEIRNGYK